MSEVTAKSAYCYVYCSSAVIIIIIIIIIIKFNTVYLHANLTPHRPVIKTSTEYTDTTEIHKIRLSPVTQPLLAFHWDLYVLDCAYRLV